MRVVRYSSVGAFLTASAELMSADPFTTSVIATIAGRVSAGSIPARPDQLWLTVADGGGRVVGAAMQTPPHPVFLSRMPLLAAVALAEALAPAHPGIAGVNGELDATTAFATVWAKLTGATSSQVTAMRMYVLGELTSPGDVPGESRLAVETDIDLVAGWLSAFHNEALPEAPSQDWEAMARGRVASRELHLWTAEGQPVAQAAVSAPTYGVARVGAVFTPPIHRRHGYGAAVTAAASRSALEAGADHVVLYTDLANPISNSIYQSIGYRPDHDAEERAFSAQR